MDAICAAAAAIDFVDVPEEDDADAVSLSVFV
jgi:hypothetical protein